MLKFVIALNFRRSNFRFLDEEVHFLEINKNMGIKKNALTIFSTPY